MEYTEQQVEIIVARMAKKNSNEKDEYHYEQIARFCLEDARDFHQAMVDALDCLDETHNG